MAINISGGALDWALKHIEKEGDTDIFPLPFEFTAIRDFWLTDVRDELIKTDLSNLKVRAFLRQLSPKHKYGFRVAMQLDPLDSVMFAALIYEIGEDIEKSRLPKEDNVVFSYRFSPLEDGTLYDSDYTWGRYREHCKKLSESEKFKFIVKADITDFYSRIYFHRLENALDECCAKNPYVRAIKSMIKGWNYNVSYGIPIGSSASRLLAELILDDVDRSLICEGSTFCRYVDDYVIFCQSENEAYEKLALLAELLAENHGLSLQQHKTEILSIQKYRETFVDTYSSDESDSIAKKCREVVELLGIRKNPYREIKIEDLEPGLQEVINSLNLTQTLKKHLQDGPEVDIPFLKLMLMRLSQFDRVQDIDIVLKNINKLYPLFKEVILYIERFRTNDVSLKKQFGEKALDLLESSFVCHLPYHRMWLFDIFTKNREWDNENRFVKLFNTYSDLPSQRQLILALGRSSNHGWFRSKRRQFMDLSPWLKRAYLVGASCLPGDEYFHWSKSISRDLDLLEKVILKWAQKNPF